MKIPMRRRNVAVVVLAVAAAMFVPASTGGASPPPEWVGTWSTALAAAGPGEASGSLAGFNNQSIRMIVRTSVSGERLRVRLSNAYGTGPIAIGRATIGLPSAPGSPTLVPDSIRELTFAGNPSATIYKGADLVSDGLDFAVPALTELAVTIFLPTATGPATWHLFARQRTYVYSGDQAGNPDGAGATVTRSSFYFLAGVDVATRFAEGSVVVLGDSISDGFSSTLNANRRWPDYLASRMAATSSTSDDVGVLNQSLAGNQVTHDGIELGLSALGESGLARLDTDVFGQTEVRSVIVELGVNDLNFSSDGAARIIEGLKQLVAQLAAKDIEVLMCTIGPFEGYASPAWTPAKEAVRVAVNDYLRTHASDFQALIDMDEVLRDPANPTKMLPAYDSGDHIHPNDAGAEAIAAVVPLQLL